MQCCLCAVYLMTGVKNIENQMDIPIRLSLSWK